MERDDAADIRAAAREIEHGRAAETEAERAPVLAVERRLADLGLQLIERAVDPRAEVDAMVVHVLGRLAGFVRRLRAHVGAIDVGDEDHVVLAGDLFRQRDLIVVHAEPIGRHDEPGPRRFHGVVVDEHALHLFTADLYSRLVLATIAACSGAASARARAEAAKIGSHGDLLD